MTQKLTMAEWRAMGRERFGDDMLSWKFVCPSCGHVQTPNDFKPHKDKGADPNSAVCECIGRYTGAKAPFPEGGPCDYAGYGLFRLSPLVVVQEDGHESQAFGFAPAEVPVSAP